MSVTSLHRKGKFLVDLDSLMDTRFTLISQITGADYAVELLNSNYNGRIEDGFGIENWEDIFKLRDNEVLKSSYITNMIPVVINIIQSAGNESGIARIFDALTLTINAYPFTLTVKEQEEFTELISVIAGEHIDIDFTYISKLFMTPEFLKATYVGMVCYTGDEWLRMYGQTLVEQPMPGFTLFIPKLIKGDRELEKTLIELSDKIETRSDGMFSAVEAGLIEAISLEYMDISAFNINVGVLNRTAKAVTTT